MATVSAQRGERFRYEGFTFDAAAGEIALAYSLDGRDFVERVRIEAADEAWSRPGVHEAARLLFLVSAVSYYKTAAPPIIDLGDTELREGEMEFLRSVFVDGLGEFAHRNGLDLTGTEFVGGRISRSQRQRIVTTAAPMHPLVPFGGGIDSIVVAEHVRTVAADTVLFVVSPAGQRYAAIEAAAGVSGLEVLRADRYLDPQVLRSADNGFFNGHVPVTAVISAIAVLTAALRGRDAVVMSNEWSASAATLSAGERDVNHQWSKSYEFEREFRAVLAQAAIPTSYFSLLRPFSELWVAQQFARLERFHLAFRSCNRAFAVDPSRRLDRWCGECDKCCFIDLILSPYLPASRLREIFDGTEPLDREPLEPTFRSLIGDPDHVKPFECVGEENECRAALVLAADRDDRADSPVVQRLAAAVRASGGLAVPVADLLCPFAEHFVDKAYVPADVLV